MYNNNNNNNDKKNIYIYILYILYDLCILMTPLGAPSDNINHSIYDERNYNYDDIYHINMSNPKVLISTNSNLHEVFIS
jgi:hypothetical protein